MNLGAKPYPSKSFKEADRLSDLGTNENGSHIGSNISD
jgi:hypothetical protein